MVNKISLVSLACLLFSGCSTTPLTPQEQKYQQNDLESLEMHNEG
jgi:PBP1b-binding outer membrane lipoprotein LpoB